MFFGGDPFEHFGGGGPRGAPRGKVDNEEFYKILGVDKSASEGDIKKVCSPRSFSMFWGGWSDAELCGRCARLMPNRRTGSWR